MLSTRALRVSHDGKVASPFPPPGARTSHAGDNCARDTRVAPGKPLPVQQSENHRWVSGWEKKSIHDHEPDMWRSRPQPHLPA